MSEEQLKAFIEKVKSDTELQEKLKAAADAEAALEIAKDAVFSISVDDLTKAQEEVTNEELEGSAGGVFLGGDTGLGPTGFVCRLTHKSAFNTWHHRPHLAGFLFNADIAADRCYNKEVAPRPPISKEQLKAFLEKVKGDTSIVKKLKADPEAVVAVVKAAGFVITAEKFTEAQRAVWDKVLESVSGGTEESFRERRIREMRDRGPMQKVFKKRRLTTDERS